MLFGSVRCAFPQAGDFWKKEQNGSLAFLTGSWCIRRRRVLVFDGLDAGLRLDGRHGNHGIAKSGPFSAATAVRQLVACEAGFFALCSVLCPLCFPFLSFPSFLCFPAPACPSLLAFLLACSVLRAAVFFVAISAALAPGAWRLPGSKQSRRTRSKAAATKERRSKQLQSKRGGEVAQSASSEQLADLAMRMS